MPQSKDTNCQIKEKDKTHQYAVSRKPISHARIYKGSKSKGWRKIYQANGEQKKAGIAILVSN